MQGERGKLACAGWALALAALLAVPLALGPETALAKAPKSICPDEYQKLSQSLRKAVAPDPGVDVASVSSFDAGVTYVVLAQGNSREVRFSLTPRLADWLSDPHRKRLVEKVLHAVRNGAAPDHGRAGIKRIDKGVWEVKLLGDMGDLRIYGCESGGKILFSQIGDHDSVKRFVKSPRCP